MNSDRLVFNTPLRPAGFPMIMVHSSFGNDISITPSVSRFQTPNLTQISRSMHRQQEPRRRDPAVGLLDPSCHQVGNHVIVAHPAKSRLRRRHWAYVDADHAEWILFRHTAARRAKDIHARRSTGLLVRTAGSGVTQQSQTNRKSAAIVVAPGSDAGHPPLPRCSAG